MVIITLVRQHNDERGRDYEDGQAVDGAIGVVVMIVTVRCDYCGAASCWRFCACA